MEIFKQGSVPEGEFFKIIVWADGIKKRCRNHRRETIRVGYVPLKEFDTDELAIIENSIKEEVKKTMKTCKPEVTVLFNRVEIGEIFERSNPFDKANINYQLAVGE